MDLATMQRALQRFQQFGGVGLGTIALGFGLIACTTPDPEPSITSVTPLSASPAPEDQVQLDEFTLVIIPDRKDKAANALLQDFEDYLEERLGLPVTLQVTEDYDTAVELLVNGSVTAAYLGPFTYVQAKALNPNLEPLVSHIEASTGRPWYTSIIVARTDRNISTLADLAGKSFGFVNESSTSGFLMPLFAFQQAKIDPDRDFESVQFGGNHDETLQLLIKGTVDAIAVDKATYTKGVETGILPPEQYHLLWESLPIPNPPLVVSDRVPASLKQKLQNAMLSAPQGLVAISANASAGYTIVQDEDYDIIRNIEAALKLP
ncbi:MAG: phosphate/phosphite/phosphonate ABC transporter substrate-binding protein [Prochlorothrix sp.]|nr:phosphate/phosphite/phosphonate ABC transporter substrate-binding protein [Prochlorothrix sp.]